jgi:hypothetical protein
VTEALLHSQLSKSFRDGIQFAWSATTIKMAETCLRYYQYVMIEGWHSRNSGPHLRFGGHYATAIEHYHKLLADGFEHEDAVRDVVLEALIDTWDYEMETRVELDELANEVVTRERVEGTGTPWESGHNLKSRETLIRSIVWYLTQFADDSAMPVRLASGAPAVELSFRLPVDNGIELVGHLDRLASFADNLYVMDQKTTGTTISARFFESFSPDSQMSLYTFAGEAVFGMPVKGVMIDAAQIAVGFTRFERGFTFRTKGQLNEWYDGALATIIRAQDATKEMNFPQNPTACGNFGGCQFRAVCARDPGVRKNFLAGDFTQGGGYDPLEKR